MKSSKAKDIATLVIVLAVVIVVIAFLCAVAVCSEPCIGSVVAVILVPAYSVLGTIVVKVWKEWYAEKYNTDEQE